MCIVACCIIQVVYKEAYTLGITMPWQFLRSAKGPNCALSLYVFIGFYCSRLETKNGFGASLRIKKILNQMRNYLPTMDLSFGYINFCKNLQYQNLNFFFIPYMTKLQNRLI